MPAKIVLPDGWTPSEIPAPAPIDNSLCLPIGTDCSNVRPSSRVPSRSASGFENTRARGTTDRSDAAVLK